MRNRLKLKAAVRNCQIFLQIAREHGSFYQYLCTFTGGERLIECDRATNAWSDAISKDLYRRGMRFVGSTIVYAYLQAIGVIVSHEAGCAWAVPAY